jgi:hypothetical protein
MDAERALQAEAVGAALKVTMFGRYLPGEET